MVSPADWRPPQIVLAALQSLSFPTSSLPFSPRVVLLHPRLCSGASVKDVSEQCVKDVMKLNTYSPAPPRGRTQQIEIRTKVLLHPVEGHGKLGSGTKVLLHPVEGHSK